MHTGIFPVTDFNRARFKLYRDIALGLKQKKILLRDNPKEISHGNIWVAEHSGRKRDDFGHPYKCICSCFAYSLFTSILFTHAHGTVDPLYFSGQLPRYYAHTTSASGPLPGLFDAFRRLPHPRPSAFVFLCLNLPHTFVHTFMFACSSAPTDSHFKLHYKCIVGNIFIRPSRTIRWLLPGYFP